MVQKDLERAGIPYETHEGLADFHAAGRHSHITGLVRSGASIMEAKELARHADIRQTAKYTHIGMEDRAEALAALPFPLAPAAVVALVEDADLQAMVTAWPGLPRGYPGTDPRPGRFGINGSVIAVGCVLVAFRAASWVRSCQRVSARGAETPPPETSKAPPERGFTSSVVAASQELAVGG